MLSCIFAKEHQQRCNMKRYFELSQPGKNMKLVDTLKPIKGEVVICLFLAMKFDLF